MKTSEFIKKVEDLGLIVEPERSMMSDESAVLNCMHIYRHGDRFPIASVGIDQAYEIDTVQTNFENDSETASASLWKLLIDCVGTPIAERKDEPHFFVRLFPIRYSINNCMSDDEGISTTNDNIFTPSTYAEFIRNHSEWRPFLKDYDPDNADVFVPVEDYV